MNCIYKVYKNFSDNPNNNEAIISSFRDCLLPIFIDMGYITISKTRFFKELKTAIQKCTKEQQDVILQKILKLTKTETRDKFIKNIIEKIINQN